MGVGKSAKASPWVFDLGTRQTRFQILAPPFIIISSYSSYKYSDHYSLLQNRGTDRYILEIVYKLILIIYLFGWMGGLGFSKQGISV